MSGQPGDSDRRCSSCSFYEPGENTSGTCRAHPPVVLVDAPRVPYAGAVNVRQEILTRWPVVRDVSWCGEWREA